MGDRKNCCAIPYSEQCLRHSRDRAAKISRVGVPMRAMSRMRCVEGATPYKNTGGASGMTRGSGARICEYEKSRRDFRELSVAEEEMIIGGLRAMVKELVEDFNRAAGEATRELYFSECLNMWSLFAMRGNGLCAECIATGYSTVESLARLVEKLEKEVLL